jgi:hypothetical protein
MTETAKLTKAQAREKVRLASENWFHKVGRRRAGRLTDYENELWNALEALYELEGKFDA